ncbi:DUF5686 family protein [Phaeocystidibacter marisrubri]|uniref:Carboxypeptidase-like regulatory domain-containing protein n=1 Tax=Phaeocystidibacter marisrubri TaxID=1577780 RepID=A0A6L3ZFU8_9FLAO|nr:DUF5686 family protein [Phaeocystidibacter marisrubri]KAB2816358.1 carboxypeptidase-like regulatory domain-containing protein [Phaeocystidibacter marisrubri]GGH68630.1 hypothetical protein GCM10011318_08850 [Phaeocystidibacter marisrubri]
MKNTPASYILFGLFLILSFHTEAQQYVGQILDEHGETLPNVTISWGEDRSQKLISDINGNFTLPHRRFRIVKFELIGYEPSSYRPEDLPSDGKIVLYEKAEALNEVTIFARENPAWRIVRNAVRHKSVNNPNRYDSYRYTSYNKNVITYNFDIDSTMSSADSAEIMADKANAVNRHLLVIESVTKKYYHTPNQHAEEVIGTKISGFENPNIATIPDGIQHFGFYDDYMRLLNKEYLNPIAKGFEDRYAFILQDTTYSGTDTTFIMKYFPTRGSNFEGFEGVIHINSNGWAIEYVTAEPWDKGKISLSMEQRYERVYGGYWFPVQLNFTLELERFPFRKNGAVMIGKTYLDSIYVNVPVPEEKFSHVQVKMREDAGLVDDSFWELRRPTELDPLERETVRHMDSIGERYNLGGVMRSTRHAYRGFLALGPINLDMKRLIASSQYEGLRLGMGVYTNEVISPFISGGGYFGYGFNDERLKYGGEIKLTFDTENDGWFKYEYKNDVRGPGVIGINYWERTSFAEQFYNVRMDRIESHEVMLRSRAWTYHIFEVGAKNFSLTPTYDYAFVNDEGEASTFYQFSEINFGWRWVQDERILANYGQKITTGSKLWPAVRLNYSRGISGIFGSDFDYNKLELGIQFDRFTKNLGRTLISLETGIVDRALPIGMNFGARPSYSSSFSVVVPNSFQAMRFNEFFNSRYVAMYFMHDFRSLLLRSGWFKPEIRIFQGVGYGLLDEPERHLNEDIKDMRYGYYESGLAFDNLIRINLGNMGYFGIGVGAFYRYGPYSFPNTLDNFSLKMAFMLSVN